MGNRADKAAEPEAEGNGSQRGRQQRSGSRRSRRRNSRKEEDDEEEERSRVSYWQLMKGGYNDLVNAIIRPPRAQYALEVLGPMTFKVDDRVYIREDLTLVNKRGLKLVCSHWKPRDDNTEKPCMIYLHGNASCRAEALECLPLILSSGLTLFALDFAGSGMSEGEYISLGWYEREDVETVVEHLRGTNQVSTIGLWGRSMGAVTALMFGDRDPTIACMILDSPFASLKQLAKELVDHAQLSVPRFAVGLALKAVRTSVKSRAGFDINKLEPVKYADKCFIPALFGAAEGDDFIRPHHSTQIFEKYAGDKNLITFDGDHNTSRPQFFNTSVGIWLHNTMIAPYQDENGAMESSAALSDTDIFSAFQNMYHMPAPLSANGAGIGISVGLPGETDDTVQRTEPEFAHHEDDDYYEQAMLRHAIELSLAEAASNDDGSSSYPQPEAESSCCSDFSPPQILHTSSPPDPIDSVSQEPVPAPVSAPLVPLVFDSVPDQSDSSTHCLTERDHGSSPYSTTAAESSDVEDCRQSDGLDRSKSSSSLPLSEHPCNGEGEPAETLDSPNVESNSSAPLQDDDTKDIGLAEATVSNSTDIRGAANSGGTSGRRMNKKRPPAPGMVDATQSGNVKLDDE